MTEIALNLFTENMYYPSCSTQLSQTEDVIHWEEEGAGVGRMFVRV